MNFNSVEYLLFLPLVFLLLKAVPSRFSWLALLVSSWYFYLTLKHLSLLLVLILVSILTYLFGLLLDRCQQVGGRRVVFWSGITANLAVLVVMKYLPFITRNINAIGHGLSNSILVPEASPMVAIGVSYFVFQALSYLIDINLGVMRAERHLGIFALYLGFFPKLLQGPIERGGDLLPQLRVPFRFDQENFRSGLLLFAWGLFKKAVLADRLALFVNSAYGDLPGHSGLPLLLATYMYALQIYYDFSGYTDMALGTARMFNIHLTQNFDKPYLARSVADFWRRWHISFSRWILDYLFKPLQFAWRDRRNAGTAVALMITFLISGLWHGASWCFVIWGGLHGLYLVFSVFYKPLQKRLHRRLGLEKSRWLSFWQIAITFNLVCIAWIFFRAANVEDAIYVLTHLVSGAKSPVDFLLSQGRIELSIVCTALAVVWIGSWGIEKAKGRCLPIWLRWSAYISLATLLLLFNADSNVGFIYFQF